MNEEDKVKLTTLDKVYNKYPHFRNLTTAELVENIKSTKAKLFDVQNEIENLKDIKSNLELELMFRPVDKKIHYFEVGDRYRIDE